jgi:hypothetical protein
VDEAQEYLAKAQESLAGAESELARRRFKNLRGMPLTLASRQPLRPCSMKGFPLETQKTSGGMTLCKRASSANPVIRVSDTTDSAPDLDGSPGRSAQG